MCQGWSTPYIGDELIPPRVLMGIQHTKLYHEVDDHPVWTPAHILILADSVKPWRDTTSRHITFVLVFWLFREVTLRCDTVKLEKKVESPDHASGFPFFFEGLQKSASNFGHGQDVPTIQTTGAQPFIYISGWWFQANLKNTPRNGSSLERPGQK